MNNDKVITKMKLCNFLLNKGFMYKETKVNYKLPNRLVWVFNNSLELQDAIDEYYSEIM